MNNRRLEITAKLEQERSQSALRDLVEETGQRPQSALRGLLVSSNKRSHIYQSAMRGMPGNKV